MRTIWVILSTLAIANVLAVAGFLLWLKGTDRLNAARVDQIRDVLRPTISDQREQAAAEKAKADQLAKDKAEADRMAEAPESSASRIARQEETEQVHLQRVLKREQEQKELRDSLDRDRAKLEDDRKTFANEKKAFEEYRRRLSETEGSQQFQKALATLQGQKPKDAKDVLSAMIRDTKIEQVVSYLSAMEERVRSKVIAEFVKEDRSVAADLLERLRTRGVALPSGPEAPPK